MSRRNRHHHISTAVKAIICAMALVTTSPAADVDPTRGLRGPAELELFIDGVIAGQRESLDFAGAVVVVVADGRIYFAKGYGYSDRERETTVDPHRTLFRIGSVSKLFTATAVMQLRERGKLTLDTDINQYLRAVKVPPTTPEPITLAHLLAHSAGFEDRSLGLFSHDPSSVKPLVITLSRELPQRVRPPGTLSVYSNHGSALAGLIVQEVSGMLWEDFVTENILNPLGMEHTTVRQPVPPALEPDLAVGYQHINGQLTKTGFEYIPIGPAGCASASGGDMARFMIAHLQSGRLGENRILSEESTRLMHSRLFSNDPAIDGMLHGFYEMNQNGERIFGHQGGLISFHTLLALMPEHGIGLFVSYNSDSGEQAQQDFWQTFLNRYFPRTSATISKPTGATAHLQSYAGEYSGLRRSASTLTKLSALIRTAHVSVDPSGYLLTTGLGDAPRRWTEITPSVFQEANGTRRIAFRTEPADGQTYLFPDFPPMAFVRHRWYESSLFQFAIAGSALLILGSALAFWPVLAWYMKNRPIIGSPPRAARLCAWLMSFLLAVFLLGFAAVLLDPRQLLLGLPNFVQHLLWLPLLAGLFALISVFFALLAWVKGYWGFPGRLHYSLVALAGSSLLWWSWHWNLLGFHY
jgi:CubicO group peptidase (beta-lactamase class C family)